MSPDFSGLCTRVRQAPLGCIAHTFAGIPAGSLFRIAQQATLTMSLQYAFCNYWWSHREGGKDNSIRIPFSASSVSTTGTGWFWGCEAALSYYCAWLLLSTTQGRQYSTQRAWGMNSKYGALGFFFNLVSFSLICVLILAPLLYKLLKANAHNATPHW